MRIYSPPQSVSVVQWTEQGLPEPPMWVQFPPGTQIYMEDEVLVGGAVVFKQRGRKVLWFIAKPGEQDAWQLPKMVVRRGESSVRGTLRMAEELAGLRGAVLEEVGRVSNTTTHKGMPLVRRIIYYLMQQKGKSAAPSYAKTQWAEFATARSRLATASEKKVLSQARTLLTTWQKQLTNLPH